MKPSVATPARRGRPALMTRDAVLALIRSTARRPPGLFRVHHTRPDLYARARRMFGSWAAAVAAAGLDYPLTVERARRRADRSRRRHPRTFRSVPQRAGWKPGR